VDRLDGAVLEARVKRLIVLGGTGRFGRTVVDALRARGLSPLVAGRRGPADIEVDANDVGQVRAAFTRGDLVVDTAGPFQERSLVLVQAAIDIGFDVIDISDDLGYAERLLTLATPIARAGIRVLNGCSSVSAVSAALIKISGCDQPVRVSGFLLPATRHTGNPGSARSMIRSVGQPVRAWRNGSLVTLRGWSEARSLALSERTIHGRLFESADALYLPRAWPTLRDVAMYVDSNTFGFDLLLRAAARVPALRRVLERRIEFGTRISRLLGSDFGALAYEIEAASGAITTVTLVARPKARVIPIAPTVLAAQRIAEGRFEQSGLVPPERQVDAYELRAYLESEGVDVRR
jgi:hypothetical protein